MKMDLGIEQYIACCKKIVRALVSLFEEEKGAFHVMRKIIGEIESEVIVC
jgi:hypothetical protein